MHTFIKSLGFAAFLFLTAFVSHVSANTSIISNDSAHTEHFSFFCPMYLFSFEESRHYVPESNYCTYSIPSTITGTPIIGLYRGTPGSSTLQSGDGVFGGGTLIRQEPNVFFDPVQDEDYFAVVYDISLDGGSGLFDAWLKNGGTPPEGAIEGQNYYLLPWKWGAKPPSEFDPVVLVPDILTTWETESGFKLDPVFNIYTNLLNTFETNGYEKDANLFTFVYNWEESSVTNAEALQDYIADIKTTCNCNRVDIIGHGMGGLITSYYIESNDYEEDVDQFISLGTPLFGVPSAYRAWEGGEITFGNPVQDGIFQSLLTAKAKAAGEVDAFNYITAKPVLSFRELLPVFVDYLSGKSYPDGYPPNSFGESVITNFSDTFLQDPLVRYTAVLGDDNNGNTPSNFNIVTSSQLPKWPDGQPTSIHAENGDGMVPRSSIENILGSADMEFNVRHFALPSEAQAYTYTVFNGEAPDTISTNSYPTACVLFLTVSAGTDLQITDPNGDRLGKNFSGSGTFNEIDRSIYSGAAMLAEYLAVANPIDGTYQVRTQGTANGIFTLTANDVCKDTTHATTTTGVTTPGQVLGYSVTVDQDDGVSITSLDSGVPSIIINTPAQDATYLTSDQIPISVTITDPESSPIAQTIYQLNGVPVNPLTPLSFTTTPVGQATFVVSATDVFGNKGYATSTFTIETPPTASEQFFFLEPITAEGHRINSNTSVFKAGSTVPVKFELVNAQGARVQADSVVAWIAPVKGPTLSAPVTETVYTTQPTSGTNYEWNGSHYQYNWKTSKNQSGYWYYLFVNVDGEVHQTIIGLR